MNTSTPENLDPQDGAPTNGAFGNGHALMVRDNEPHGLAPYGFPAMGGPAHFDGQPSGLNLVRLLHALRRRWLLALCVGLMLAVPAAGLVWLIAPTNYDVAGYLHVGDPPSVVGGPGVRSSEYDYFRKTQVSLIKSVGVLQEALKMPGIADLPMLVNRSEPIKFLEDEISVTAPMETELLQIRMQGKDPQQLVKIVNAVRQSYLENIVNGAQVDKLRKISLLDRQYKDSMDQMHQKEEMQSRLAKDAHSTDLKEVQLQLSIEVQKAAEARAQVSRTNSELADVLAKIEVLKERDKDGNGPSEHMIESMVNRDQVVAGLQQRIEEVRGAYDMHVRDIGNRRRDPKLTQLKGMMEDYQTQLDDRRKTIRPGIIQELTQAMSGDGARLPELQSKANLLSGLLRTQQADLDATNKRFDELNNSGNQYQNLETQIKQFRDNADRLWADLQQAKLDADQTVAQRVTPLGDVVPPEGASFMMRYMLTVFAGLVGLVLGAGTVVGVEYQARRLNTSSELGVDAGLRVLGTVPNLAEMSRAKGLSDAGVIQGVLAESVDSIRTILLQQSREGAPHVIMITSAGDSEGKTTVACHLAASLARSGRRTLLVDGDLRSPTAHLVFGAAPEPGVCEVLRGDVDLAAALQPTAVDGLMFIPGGQCDYTAVAALSKKALPDLIRRMREEFEFVVIDAGPVLTYADTLLIGAHVDGAVLSVRRDHSRMHKLNEARDRLDSVGIRIIGAVVNGISEHSRRPAYALPAAV